LNGQITVMKRLIIALFVSLLFTSCGVGTYSVAGGKSDDALVSVSVSQKITNPVLLEIDGAGYSTNAVFNSNFKKQRDIKKTARNAVTVASGKHEIKVLINGEVVFEKNVMLAPGEHRIIEL